MQVVLPDLNSKAAPILGHSVIAEPVLIQHEKVNSSE